METNNQTNIQATLKTLVADHIAAMLEDDFLTSIKILDVIQEFYSVILTSKTFKIN